MTRDWNVIKAILLELEARQSCRDCVRPSSIPDYAPEVVACHIAMLIQAGLIEGECSQAIGRQPDCTACAITWQGYEFLDSVRNITIWNRITAIARDKGLALSFEVIKTASSELIKTILK